MGFSSRVRGQVAQVLRKVVEEEFASHLAGFGNDPAELEALVGLGVDQNEIVVPLSLDHPLDATAPVCDRSHLPGSFASDPNFRAERKSRSIASVFLDDGKVFARPNVKFAKKEIIHLDLAPPDSKGHPVVLRKIVNSPRKAKVRAPNPSFALSSEARLSCHKADSAEKTVMGGCLETCSLTARKSSPIKSQVS